jgi:polyhydroxyalkanoate synthase subunit PhaE
VASGDRSGLAELAGLCWDAYERTFGRLLESPSLGYSREDNQKLLRGFDAWLDFCRASSDYQVILADAWARAFERLMRELVSRAEKGEKIEGLQQVLRIWGGVVDGVFDEVFRSEEYGRVQGRLLNAAMTYRLRERECVEAFMKTSHLPTRSELDDAYRTIYELRKEVKALKKALGQLRAETTAGGGRQPSSGEPTEAAASAGHRRAGREKRSDAAASRPAPSRRRRP